MPRSKPAIKVNYSNLPWAQYRDAMITKFVGNAPIDVLWVSDSWLPEWADAGWLAPIDQYRTLTAYNADASEFCNQSMTYKGKQYGLTYYTDYMGFICNAALMEKAGIASPPASWAEVVEQAKIVKSKGLSEWPLLIPMAQETWLIEFLSAMVFSHGGGFVDDKGNAVMQEGGARAALRWLVDAVHQHKIISPACVETGELAGLKTFSAGQHAFALLPKYRPAHPQRSGAKPDRRARRTGADAAGRRRIACHRRLDAILRHDRASPGGRNARREHRQAHRMVRR